MRKILLNSVRVTATLIYDCNEIRNDNEFYGEEQKLLEFKNESDEVDQDPSISGEFEKEKFAIYLLTNILRSNDRLSFDSIG